MMLWGIDHDPLLLQSPGIHGLQVEALEAFRPLSCHNENFNWLPCKQLLKPQAYPDLSVLKQHKNTAESMENAVISPAGWHHPNGLRCPAFRFLHQWRAFQKLSRLWMAMDGYGLSDRKWTKKGHIKKKKKGHLGASPVRPCGWEGFNVTVRILWGF